MVNFCTPNVFVTLWFELDYVINPPLDTLMIYKFNFICAFGSVVFKGANEEFCSCSSAR
jgi:hypothetical protein